MLCRGFLGFPPELVYGRVLPGAAVSLLVGNAYYAWQAKKLADAEGRTDVCAQPYGINTVSLFAFVFLVMAPVKFAAEAAGAEDPATLAWRAGLLACFGSGPDRAWGRLRRRASPTHHTARGPAVDPGWHRPRFHRLGIPVSCLCQSVVGIASLGVVLVTYFGRVRFKGKIPGGLVAVVIGVALSWITGLAPTSAEMPPSPSLYAPLPVIGDLIAAFSDTDLLINYGAVIVPMGIFSVVGSLQNIEAAEAAGGSVSHCPVPGGQRDRHARGMLLRFLFSDHDLHRAPGLEGHRRPCRLFDAQRRVRDGHLSDRDSGAPGLGRPGRRGHGHHFVDRPGHGRAGVHGHTTTSRAGGRHRPAARDRGLGSPVGQTGDPGRPGRLGWRSR